MKKEKRFLIELQETNTNSDTPSINSALISEHKQKTNSTKSKVVKNFKLMRNGNMPRSTFIDGYNLYDLEIQ